MEENLFICGQMPVFYVIDDILILQSSHIQCLLSTALPQFVGCFTKPVCVLIDKQCVSCFVNLVIFLLYYLLVFICLFILLFI